MGIHQKDQEEYILPLIEKLIHLRIFADAEEKMNLSLLDVQGEVLLVSQFTLYGDCRKSRRPSFTDAAPYEIGRQFYEQFIAQLKEKIPKVASGIFGAYMKVKLVNDGPVTLMIEYPGYDFLKKSL